MTRAVSVRPPLTFTRMLDGTGPRLQDMPGVTYGAAIVLAY